MERQIADLVASLTQGRLSRRAFIARASSLGLSATAIGSLLAACGGSKSGTSTGGAVGAPAGKDLAGDIVLYKGPFSPNEPKQIGELIASFTTKFPQVKVKREQFDFEAMDAQFPTKFLSDSPPDVNTIPDIEYGKWVAQDVFEDLTPYVTHSSWQQEHDAIPDRFWQIAKSKEGRIYGIPWWGVVLSMLYVNTDLLGQAGVTDVNSSLDAFHTAARKVRGLGKSTYGFTIRTTQANPAAFDWAAWMHAGDADLLNADWTSCGIDTGDSRSTFQLLSDMQAKEKLSPPPGAYDENGLKDLFRAGRVGMLHADNGFVAVLRDTPPKFTYDAAAIPTGPGGPDAAGMWGVGLLTMSKKSKNKPAAWELMKHLSSADVVSDYFQKVSLLPNRTDLTDRMFKDDPFTAKVQREILPHVKGWQLHPKLGAMLGRSQPSFDKLYAGSKSAADALKEACSAIDSLL